MAVKSQSVPFSTAAANSPRGSPAPDWLMQVQNAAKPGLPTPIPNTRIDPQPIVQASPSLPPQQPTAKPMKVLHQDPQNFGRGYPVQNAAPTQKKKIGSRTFSEVAEIMFSDQPSAEPRK